MRSEEIPEQEPDEPEEEPAQAEQSVATLVPSVGQAAREFEFRTEALSLAELTDGSTLARKLTEASKEGWDLVSVLDAGDHRVIVYRRGKRSERQSHPVGFFPQSRS
ncbi:MAG TPA: hypothetical protein VF137_06125 [Candidatus Dormibacteraeota bacterium]